MLRSRSIREGAVGLFALLGLVIFGGITIWLRGGNWGEQAYQIIVEFDNVAGMQLGAPVQYRGVQVGRLVALRPKDNKVEALLEISSDELRIPRDVTIQTSRYGLIGEAAIDINPQSNLPPQAQSMSPIGSKCNPKLILCDNTRLQGDSGSQLIETLTRLAETYSNPEFFNNLNRAAKNASLTLNDVSKLTKDFSKLSKTAETEIKLVSRNFSNTSASVNRTTASLSRTADNASNFVNNANTVLLENRQSLNQAIRNANQLVSNANQLIVENRQGVSTAIDNINRMSDRLAILAGNLNETALKINTTMDAADTKKMLQNLEVTLANTAAVSQELREVSETLNDPTLILTLQQTLDSARLTFENAQKITSDVDELVGDPEFRSNLRRLVNGLSNLVSSSQQYEQQMIAIKNLQIQTQSIAQQIEPITQEIYCSIGENDSSINQSSREKLAYMCNSSRQNRSRVAPVRPLLVPKDPVSQRPEEASN